MYCRRDNVTCKCIDVDGSNRHRITEHIENEPLHLAFGHAVFIHHPAVFVEAVFDGDFVAVFVHEFAVVKEFTAVCNEFSHFFGIVKLIQAVAVFGETNFTGCVVITALRVFPTAVENETKNYGDSHTAVDLCVEKKRIVECVVSVVVETVVVCLEQRFDSCIFEAGFEHTFVVEVGVDIVNERKCERTTLHVIHESVIVVVEHVVGVYEVVEFVSSGRVLFKNVYDLRLDCFYIIVAHIRVVNVLNVLIVISDERTVVFFAL